MSDTDLLAAQLRRHDRDRFLATLFAPPDRRGALWALLGFNLEIARAREAVSQPLLGQIRLQWWREAVEEIYRGGPVRRHGTATALADAVRQYGVSRGHLDAMIDAREHDLDDQLFPNLAALEGYAEGSSARLLQAWLEILGVTDPISFGAARDIGIAWSLAGLIRAIPFHAAARRLYLPADMMRAAGLDEAAYFVARPTPALSEVARQLSIAARARLAAARMRRRAIPVAAHQPLLLARIASGYLNTLARAGYDPYDARVRRPHPLSPALLWWGSLLRRY